MRETATVTVRSTTCAASAMLHRRQSVSQPSAPPDDHLTHAAPCLTVRNERPGRSRSAALVLAADGA